jgi:hypothetical protein
MANHKEKEKYLEREVKLGQKEEEKGWGVIGNNREMV